MKDTVFNMENKNVGEVELADEIFAAPVNKALIYEVVKMQRAGQREGTAATRNHWMVSGTTAKMYRQKGTGRARHGDARTNIFVGGGKAFGPHPKDYSYRIPRKARKGGVCSALSLKKKEGKLLIVDDLSMTKIKTKDAAGFLGKMGVVSGLIVIDGENKNLERSVRNIPGMKVVKCEGINVYDIVKYEHAIMTKAAVGKVQELLKI